jgi:COP9 signalosome complex subunit 2
LKALYQRALQIKSAVPHPKIMGIIRECGGKMNLAEENWEEAYSDFFESFKNYDEAGSLQRIQVLKYLVLTTMLMKSSISPFDSQETKPYKEDGRISAMTRLVDAYQRDDVHGYMLILRDNQDLLADPFIAENIDEVTRNMRTKAMLKLIAPYSQFRLSFVSNSLSMPPAEVLEILRDLIITGQLKGKIDLQKETVQLTSGSDAERVDAIQDWSKAVNSLWASLMSEDVGQGDEAMGMGDILGGGRSYDSRRQRGGGGGRHHGLKGPSVLR